MTFFGMMNVRNEAEWIGEAIESLLPLCDFVFVFDDHSTDGTVARCRGFGSRVVLYESEFSGLDLTRDKNLIYGKLLAHLPASLLNEDSPFWVAAIDGDEALAPGAAEAILAAAKIADEDVHSLALQVCYLWDNPDQVRVDGRYAEMFRPSVFHVINPAFQFDPTPSGGNLHCPNVPNELVGLHRRIPARLKHYGYLRREARLRKYLWMNERDPNNAGEDFYRHMVIGDLPSLPPDSRTKWAGPLKLEPFR